MGLASAEDGLTETRPNIVTLYAGDMGYADHGSVHRVDWHGGERTVFDDLPSGQRPRLCDISFWKVGMLGRLRLDDALVGRMSPPHTTVAIRLWFSGSGCTTTTGRQ